MPGVLRTSLNFSKIVLGVSLMQLPAIYSRNGYLNATLMILVVGGVFSIQSLYLLFEVYQIYRIDDFEVLVKKVLGPYHYFYTYISILLISLVCIFIYIDMLKKLILFLTEKWVNYFLVGMVFFVNLMFTKFEHLEFANYLGWVAVILLSFSTFFSMFFKFDRNFLEIYSVAKNGDFLNDISRIALSFCSHYCILPYLSKQKISGFKNHRRRNLLTLSISILTTVFIYCFIGLTGFVSFPKCSDMWIESLSGNFKQILGCIFIGITLLGYPLCFIDLRQRFESVFLQNYYFSNSKNSDQKNSKLFLKLFLNVSIVNAITLISYEYCYKLKFISPMISFFCGTTMFYLPSVLYLKTFGFSKPESLIAVLCLIFCGFLSYRSICGAFE